MPCRNQLAPTLRDKYRQCVLFFLLGSSSAQYGPVQIVCTLGPKSRDVDTIEQLLRAGMSIARFNFSHGSHEYHQARFIPLISTLARLQANERWAADSDLQETLNALNKACKRTGLMCAVLLDTKGPEIRTGFLKVGNLPAICVSIGVALFSLL